MVHPRGACMDTLASEFVPMPCPVCNKQIRVHESWMPVITDGDEAQGLALALWEQVRLSLHKSHNAD